MDKIDRKKFIRSAMLAAGAMPFGFGARGNDAGAGKVSMQHETGTADAKTKLKICAFSKNFQWLEPYEMAVLAASIGFDGIDLTVRPNGHVLPERAAEDLPKAVAAVEKAGLKVYMITTTINDAKEKNTEAILKTASALGIRYYRTDWFHYDAKMEIHANLAMIKEKLSGLAAINRQYNMHGAYQNHTGNYFGASIWDLWMGIKELDPAYLGCQYDIRHAMVEATSSWEAPLQVIQPYIKTIAVKDFNWVKQNNKWQANTVPLGEGIVDYKTYLDKIKEYKFNGPISLHCEFPLGGAEDGAKQLTISKDSFMQAVKKELSTLKGWLEEKGL
jgi:sugar phosphate isomerase/epimerase